MLVLARERDEEILIGDSIRLVVIEIRGDKVRLGIEAPRDVPVDRREVRRAKEQGCRPGALRSMLKSRRRGRRLMPGGEAA